MPHLMRGDVAISPRDLKYFKKYPAFFETFKFFGTI